MENENFQRNFILKQQQHQMQTLMLGATTNEEKSENCLASCASLCAAVGTSNNNESENMHACLNNMVHR